MESYKIKQSLTSVLWRKRYKALTLVPQAPNGKDFSKEVCVSTKGH